jgi:hypothetical protein
MMTCSFKLVLSQIYFFNFSKMVHFLVFASHSLGLLSPAAPAAGSAASGSAPAAAPGCGHPDLPLRASPLLLAASPPALLTSRVCVAACVLPRWLFNIHISFHVLGHSSRPLIIPLDIIPFHAEIPAISPLTQSMARNNTKYMYKQYILPVHLSRSRKAAPCAGIDVTI